MIGTQTNRIYPWFIAVFAGIALMVSNGQTISGLSVYDVEFINEFGWSRGEIKLRDMVTLLLAGLAAPFVGVLLDRYGVRRCMLAGWGVLILSYFAYSRLGSLTGLYLIHAAFALVLVVCGLNAAVILVSKWFTRYRGTAIGIALMGTSMGGIVFPQYGTAMIELLDWRGAFAWGSLFPAVLLLITWFAVREAPPPVRPAASADAAGAAPESDADDTSGAAAAAGPATHAGAGFPPGGGVSFATALRSPTFWALAVIAMTTFYTVLGVQAHIFLYMSDAQFDARTATNAVSLFFFCALVGKFVFGLASDFLNPRRVFFGNILVMLIGSLILVRMDIALIWVAVVTFGLGWGGVYTVLQLTVMNTFGTRDAGKILGTITVLDATGGGLGIWLTGVIYDATGSYEIPFLIFAGLILIALAALTRVRPLAAQAAPGTGAAQSAG
ncbi:MAG: MFS transporter [Proteobacteria bacterium]|nr:MFS transporter [Pseudomonadota bacterium]